MKIAITRADGGVSIMTLLLDAAPGAELEAALEAELEKWRATAPGQYVAHREIREEEIPADRTFRNAWTPALTVDMSRAREIQRERMRAARAPKLAALDVEYQRADETGNTAEKARVAARKQALRDVTADPRIDAAGTPEELKTVWPAALSL